jgi:ABC-2 type transport system ATP-binding protein
MDNVIEVTDLTKNYAEVAALHGVSFTIARGEIFGLLGPNGAGKTTLLEILEGHREATGGTARVLGMNPRGAGADLRDRIGVVPQNASFELQLTTREHLSLFAGYYRRHLPVDTVLELVGLTAKAGARVGRLSGGQQRRLDLALAIIGDPDVVFLDEPTTGFDVVARDRAWALITAMRDAGKTVILTTHNMAEAQRLSDRVAVIFDGRIVALGDPGRLLAAEQAGTISTRLAGDLVDRLPRGLLAHVRRVDGRVEISVEDTRAALHDLTGWAIEAKQPLPELEVRRPSLEEMYLDLLAEHGAPGADRKEVLVR